MSLWRLIENILALDTWHVWYCLSWDCSVVLRLLIAIEIKKCETEGILAIVCYLGHTVLFPLTLTTRCGLPLSQESLISVGCRSSGHSQGNVWSSWSLNWMSDSGLHITAGAKGCQIDSLILIALELDVVGVCGKLPIQVTWRTSSG